MDRGHNQDGGGPDSLPAHGSSEISVDSRAAGAVARRFPVIVAATVLVCVLGTTTATAQLPSALSEVDRLVDGGFESGHISLRLPPEGPRPVVLGAWATRGAPPPRIVVDDRALEGSRVLSIAGPSVGAPALLQDVAVGRHGYLLELAYLRRSGRQRIALLVGSRADAAPAVELLVGGDGLQVTTPDGTWSHPATVDPGGWRSLAITADPRSDLQTVVWDGRAVLAVPGVPDRSPGTLQLGGEIRRSGAFLFDAVALGSLADVELNAIRRSLADAGGEIRGVRRLTRRLDAAAVALRRGSERLAATELRVVRRALREGRIERLPPDVEGSTSRALEALLDLLRR